MSWDAWRARLARESEPTVGQLTRVRSRLDAQLRSTRSLLTEGSEPHPAQIARVQARLRGVRRPARIGWTAPAFGAISLAALAVFGLSRPSGELPLTTLPLAGSVALSGEVQVEANGTGHATGAGQAWAIAWERGAVSVAVAPGTGQHVSVRTREAEVRVIGTQFVVDRGALGTTVSVAAGHVAVDCTTGEHHELAPGDEAECLPVTAAGLLARAHALGEAGRPAAAQLSAIEQGLALDPGVALEGELRAARLAPLIALGEIDAARLEAATYLATAGAPRADEVRRIAGRLAIHAGDCPAVVEHLQALPELSPEEAAWLDRCRHR